MPTQDDPFAQFSISGARRSASGEASRRAELERVKKMTPVERVLLGLELGRRHRELFPEERKAAKK